MVQAGHFTQTLKRFRWLYLSALPGLAIGITILSAAAPQSLGAFLGVVLIIYAIFALANPTFHLKERWSRFLAAPVGFLTGIVNGATGSQVMPALPFLMSLKLSRDELVQAINISFTLGSIVMLGGLTTIGILSLPMLAISVLGIIPVWIGITAGGWVRTRLPETWFRTGVLLMLIGLGGNLFLSAL